MGSVAVSNTFTNDTVAEAPQVNTNFSDLVNYINARNSGSAKWDALAVSGNSVLDGTLSVGGIDFATALSTAISADGWIASGETWTYASSSTFTISGDKTSKYSVGDKIKIVQTSQKYFYITGVSYSAPNTTITVCAGNVYSIANAAITSPYYSKMATPHGFPGHFTFAWTSVIGFSGIPVKEGYFSINGRSLTVGYHFFGTSNDIYLKGTMPITTTTPLSVSLTSTNGQGKNDGSLISTAYGYLSGNEITCYPSHGNVWFAYGLKQCAGVVFGVI